MLQQKRTVNNGTYVEKYKVLTGETLRKRRLSPVFN